MDFCSHHANLLHQDLLVCLYAGGGHMIGDVLSTVPAYEGFSLIVPYQFVEPLYLKVQKRGESCLQHCTMYKQHGILTSLIQNVRKDYQGHYVLYLLLP